MVLQEKIVTDTLQKLGDRIAAQKNGEGSVGAAEDEKSHGLSPEQKKAFQDRLRDGEHLLQDLRERISASVSIYEAHAAIVKEECRIAEENLHKLQDFSGKVDSVQLPAGEKADLVQLSDIMHELGSLRIQWASLDALLKKDIKEKQQSGKDVPAVSAFPLKKAVIAFGLILFLCTLLLAAAIIVAWKVPF